MRAEGEREREREEEWREVFVAAALRKTPPAGNVLLFHSGGGIISGSRKRQRIRVVWIALDTAQKERASERRERGITEKCQGNVGRKEGESNVPGFIITIFSH